MRKKLIEQFVKDASITKKQAETVLKSFIENVQAAIKKGKKFQLVGFGTFSLSKRKARKGRNPKTGDSIAVKPKKLPFFKVGKELKERIAG